MSIYRSSSPPRNIFAMAENENINNLHFFEGVEKLLEIWFAPNQSNKNADLRKIPRYVSILRFALGDCCQWVRTLRLMVFSIDQPIEDGARRSGTCGLRKGMLKAFSIGTWVKWTALKG